jgi:co-chaperonin GroES (HSP10)
MKNDARELPTNDLIRQVLGETHSVSLGWRVLVKVHTFGDNYILEDGTKSILERPDLAKDRDKTQLGVGQILMIGDSAFKGDKFKYWKVLPQVGDFVKWEKYSGTFDTENGVNLIDLQDYMIIRIVKNPDLASYHNWTGN